MIRFICGKCGKLLHATDDAAGKAVACPGCNRSLEIPKPARWSGPQAVSKSGLIDPEVVPFELLRVQEDAAVHLARIRARLAWIVGLGVVVVLVLLSILMNGIQVQLPHAR